jgi:glycosyltransferase 2 family protein
MPRNLRRILLLLVAVVVLGGLGYKFRNSISLEGFKWSMVGDSLRHARIDLLLLSLATIYACFAIRALRWNRFSRWMGTSTFGGTYAATLMGFTCNFLLGRAGEPIRPVLIARKNSLSIPGMFGVYVLERIADIAATVTIAALALLLFRHHENAGGAASTVVTKMRSGGAVLFVGLIFVVGFLIYFRFRGAAWLGEKLKHPSWRLGWRAKLLALLEGFSEGLQGIRTFGDLAALIGYTAMHWLLIACCYFFIVHAFGGELASLSFANVILVLAFSLFGSVIQLPGVGGGAQLATFLALTVTFGVESGPAAVASIIIWLITFAGCCLVGLPLLLKEGWSMGDLKQMAVAAEHKTEAAALTGEMLTPSANTTTTTEVKHP